MPRWPLPRAADVWRWASIGESCGSARLAGQRGFAERFGAAMAKGTALIDCLNECEGIKVRRFPHGSNIFPVALDPCRRRDIPGGPASGVDLSVSR